MTYWKFAPGTGAENWDIQRDSGYIGIGWPQLGNMIGETRSTYDRRRAELAQQLGLANFDGFSNVWNFIHEIAVGDIIIANRGIHYIVGVGVVTGPAYYIEDDNNHFRTRRTVEWSYVNNNGFLLPNGQFAQATLTRVNKNAVIQLADKLLLPQNPIPIESGEDRITNDPAVVLSWTK